MTSSVIHTLVMYYIMCVLVFVNIIYVYGEENKDIAEQGRLQYQIIKEKGTLPKYGPCWKAALEHLNEGCRFLSEDTQSDMALHITNCFLAMSGHETYNCDLDKKPNLRGICINSMSDRAFNVYTEFYTHTQNICWFLRGQIWHETIAENTLKVGKQLEVSVQNQEDLLKVQKESIELQEQMLIRGRFLEQVLGDVFLSTKAHQEILKLLTQSVTSLQTWIVGEISWIDSIIFNVFALFLIFILTSSRRTMPARLPLFFLLFLNLVIERLICFIYTNYQDNFNTHNLYSNIYKFVWYSRYAFTFLGAFITVYNALTFTDFIQQNVTLLNKIQEQNKKILHLIDKFQCSENSVKSTSNIDFISENVNKRTLLESNFSGEFKGNSASKVNCHSPVFSRFTKERSVDVKETCVNDFSSNLTRSQLFESRNKKYNLRSRQGTPDSGIFH